MSFSTSFQSSTREGVTDGLLNSGKSIVRKLVNSLGGPGSHHHPCLFSFTSGTGARLRI